MWLNFLLRNSSDFKNELSKNRYLVVNDLHDIPFSIHPLKENLRIMGVKSLLLFPIQLRSECIGFFGFDDSIQYHQWNDNDVTTLRIFGGIFENLLERLVTEEEIKYLTFHDKLTGLFNRAYFEEEIKRSASGKFVYTLCQV